MPPIKCTIRCSVNGYQLNDIICLPFSSHARNNSCIFMFEFVITFLSDFGFFSLLLQYSIHFVAQTLVYMLWLKCLLVVILLDARILGCSFHVVVSCQSAMDRVPWKNWKTKYRFFIYNVLFDVWSLLLQFFFFNFLVICTL